MGSIIWIVLLAVAWLFIGGGDISSLLAALVPA